jgi:hypothetical protein
MKYARLKAEETRQEMCVWRKIEAVVVENKLSIK